MESSNSAIAEAPSPAGSISKRTKLRRSVDERRRMVEASLSPGATITAVAARHGVRPNQLSAWRKLYREGRLGTVSAAPLLLPVKLVKPGPAHARADRGVGPDWPGQIELELARGQVRITGQVHGDSLRLVLESLLR